MSQQVKLLKSSKVALRNGLIAEAIIWEIPVSDRYPEGYKYRLAIVDPRLRRILILFDNHFQKGHHVHLENGDEQPYLFRGVDALIEEFTTLVRIYKERE